MSESTEPQIVVPDLCGDHQRELIVWELAIMPDGPWRAHLVVTQILMFQAAAASERVLQRTAGDASDLSVVLAEIGCLGCAFRAEWKRAIQVMRKGLTHAAKVSRNELADPDWGEWGRGNA